MSTWCAHESGAVGAEGAGAGRVIAVTEDGPASFRVRSEADRAFLGLEPAEGPGASAFAVTPHLTRPDGRLFGGAGIAVSVAAIEAAAGAPALWATAQLIGSPAMDERVHVRAEVLAAGRRVQQVQVTATGPDGLAFVRAGRRRRAQARRAERDPRIDACGVRAIGEHGHRERW